MFWRALTSVERKTRAHRAISFWPRLWAATEFLTAVGHDWENELSFDCHESYVVRRRVPKGLVSYLVRLLRGGRAVTDIPTEARYVEFRQKCAELAKKFTGALKRHVECGGTKPRVGGPGESSCSDSLCKESAPIKARTRSIGAIAGRRM